MPIDVLTVMPGDAAAHSVYVALAVHADPDGRCDPLQSTLADLVGKSEATVRAAIRRLKQARMVESTPRLDDAGHKLGNQYRLLPIASTGSRPGARSRSRTGARSSRARDRLSREEQMKETPPTPEPPTLALVLDVTDRLLDVPTIVDEVFAEWRAVTRRTARTVLTDARRRRIEQRVADGYALDDLLDAVRGVMRSDWHVENGYTDIATVLRDGEQVEKFRDLQRAPVRARPPARQTADQRQAMIDQHFGLGGAS